MIERWQKDDIKQTTKDSKFQEQDKDLNEQIMKDDAQDPYSLCDDAVEAFMKGNFPKYQRELDKLDNISTSNIRNLLSREEEMLVRTKEDDFN